MLRILRGGLYLTTVGVGPGIRLKSHQRLVETDITSHTIESKPGASCFTVKFSSWRASFKQEGVKHKTNIEFFSVYGKGSRSITLDKVSTWIPNQ